MLQDYSLKTNAIITSFCNAFLKATDVCVLPLYVDRKESMFRFSVVCTDLSVLVANAINDLDLLFVVDHTGHVECTWLEQADGVVVKHEFPFNASELTERLFIRIGELANLFTQSFKKRIQYLAKNSAAQPEHTFSKIVAIKEVKIPSYEIVLENNLVVGVVGNRDDVKEGNFAYLSPSGVLEIIPATSLN